MSASAQPKGELSLFDRVARRDRSALEEMFDLYAGALLPLMQQILGDERGEEALRSFFVAVWRGSVRYDSMFGGPGAWIVRAARDHAVRIARTEGIKSVPTIASGVSALETLQPLQRALIREAFYRGMSVVELADEHGLPEELVRVELRDGMDELRRMCASGGVDRS